VPLSRSARSAWIEITASQRENPHDLRSRSARSAWIEIEGNEIIVFKVCRSRSARSAWIEIAFGVAVLLATGCRAPLGARGLK